MAVTANTDGTFTVSNGTTSTVYTSLREALDAELAAVATFEKPAYLRDPETGDENGQWRWLPACSVEPQAVRGIRIDAEAIHEMADSLNTMPRAIPIDGGPTPPGMLPSEVHGTPMTGGATPANGRAHWGVVVDGPGADEARLYLYSELVPVVATEVDAGRIAEGSVAFKPGSTDGELPRDITLNSFALTNDPAVQDLAPANSVRAPMTSLTTATRARALKEIRMSKQKPSAPAAKITIRSKLAHLRGPALDKLAQIAALLGVSIDDEMSEDAWESPTLDAIRVVREAAKAEKILSASPATPPAAPVAASASTRNAMPGDGNGAQPPPPPPAGTDATKAAGVTYPFLGVADEAGLAAALSQVCDALRGALNLPADADAAAVLDAVKTNADKITGAVGSTMAATPPDGESAPPPGTVKASASERDVAGDINLRSELTTLRAAREADQKRIAELEQREERRTVEAEVDTAFRAAGRLISADDRKLLVDDLCSTKDLEVRKRNLGRATGGGAPTGSVMGAPPVASRTGGTGTLSLREAAKEFETAVRSEHPKWDAHFIVAEAQRRARAKYPHLATNGGGSPL